MAPPRTVLAPSLFADFSALVIVCLLAGRSCSRRAYLFFLLDGLCISWLGEQMRLAMRKAAEANSEVAAARGEQSSIPSQMPSPLEKPGNLSRQ
jgi:hypothetical protein